MAPPPPHLTIVSIPGVDGQFEVSWPWAEAGMSFRCGIDNGVPFLCDPRGEHVSLPEGRHTFGAQAIDLNGNSSEFASIAVTAVDTEITAAPLEDLPRRSVTFAARSGIAQDFECSIDGGAFAACAQATAPGASAALTLPAVADGRHTLRVRGRHGSDVDESPASRTWIQDTIAPDTSLRTTATGFELSSNESGVTFRCRVGNIGFGGCDATYTLRPLSPGAYTFEAHAMDRAGNIDPTPARHTWTIAPPRPAATPTASVKPADPVAETLIVDAVPATPVVRIAAPQRLDFELRHAVRGGRLTRLAVTRLTMRADLRVIVKCPKGRRCPSGFPKWNVKRDLSLKRLVGKRLPAGTKITVRARHGQLTESKTITIRTGA